MSYEIALPRQFSGDELMKALEQAADRREWLCYKKIATRSFSVSSGSIKTEPTSFEVVLTHEVPAKFEGPFYDTLRSNPPIKPDKHYSKLCLHPSYESGEIPKEVKKLILTLYEVLQQQ
jgi:hypothetical protein